MRRELRDVVLRLVRTEGERSSGSPSFALPRPWRARGRGKRESEGQGNEGASEKGGCSGDQDERAGHRGKHASEREATRCRNPVASRTRSKAPGQLKNL